MESWHCGGGALNRQIAASLKAQPLYSHLSLDTISSEYNAENIVARAKWGGLSSSKCLDSFLRLAN